MKLHKTIPCKTGIYDARYTIRNHRDGSVTVRAPYVRWRNNTGALAYRNHRIANANAVEAIRAMQEAGTLVIESPRMSHGLLSIGDVINGYAD